MAAIRDGDRENRKRALLRQGKRPAVSLFSEITPMHDILVHANNYRIRTRSQHYAAEMATLMGAALTGVFVCEPILPLPQAGVPPVFPEYYDFAAGVVKSAQEAEPEFLGWAGKLGVEDASWQVAEGHLAEVLASSANWNDLLVLESGTKAPWSSVGELGQVLMSCGVPCLVVPDTHGKRASTDTIAVAWNGSPESIRAVHAAIPLLKRAKRIVLLHGARTEPYSLIGWKPPVDIATHLKRHGLSFGHRHIEVEDKSVGAELLTAAWEIGADMLVMGAYGKTRFSEWIFGGATRHVLEHSKLPVFMRH